ncbi:MAG: sialate O-acetylesterase [Verrucomicrobiales bacterium]|nr:sialate O-acetylesterase [Verrucomicrobiales bacterium]
MNKASLLVISAFLLPVLFSSHSLIAQTKEKAKSPRRAATPPPTKPPLVPADISVIPEGSESLEIFLLMGQSNMKGRGVMPEEPLRDPRIVMMHKPTDGWYLARHPLHLVGNPETFEGHDNAGVGPGLAFAETLLKHRPNVRVALVPCAVGGTRIGSWAKGARLYEEAIRKAKLALEAGPEGKTRIAGALWLQGESDAREERIPLYADALSDLVKNLRSDLEIEDLPFLVSTIGEMRADAELRKSINEILLDLPNRIPGTAAVDARELKGHIGDFVHMDTPTQNEIGRRFARLYLKLPKTRKSH